MLLDACSAQRVNPMLRVLSFSSVILLFWNNPNLIHLAEAMGLLRIFLDARNIQAVRPRNRGRQPTGVFSTWKVPTLRFDELISKSIVHRWLNLQLHRITNVPARTAKDSVSSFLFGRFLSRAKIQLTESRTRVDWDSPVSPKLSCTPTIQGHINSRRR